MKKYFHSGPSQPAGCLTTLGSAVVALLIAVPSAAGQPVSAPSHNGVLPRVGTDRPQDRLVFRAQPITAEIEIDGRLVESAWNGAGVVPLRWEVDPAENEEAPVVTECRVGFDDESLYFGCRAGDPRPERIRAYYTDRDETAGHDRIFLVLDPFNDARRAFEFGVSALGVQEDRVFDASAGRAETSWDAVWRSAGRVTSEGYEVEAAIPFRSLRFPETRSPQTWGFYVRREWPRSESLDLRSMRWDRDEACVLCQANLLRGIRASPAGANVEVTPTLTTTRVDRRDGDGAGLVSGAVEPEPGVDARWGVTTDLALNLTVNPDFSQVEADVPRLSATNRFTLRFPEKRPFFLEGADVFDTPIEAVFTRTVVDPSVGAKVTGKIGSSAIGAVAVRDETTGLLVPGNQGSAELILEQPANTAVLRYRRDVGESGTLGGLYAGRMGAGYGNHVGGADLFVRPLSALSVQAQYLHSATDDPPRSNVDGGGAALRDGTFGGDAGHLRVQYRDREWDAGVLLFGRTPEFRADAGFVPRVDVWNAGFWAGRTFWGKEGAPFTAVDVRTGAWHSVDWSGRLTEEGVWSNVVYTGPWQSTVWLNPVLSREWFDSRIFPLFRTWTGFRATPVGALQLELSTMAGDAIDFANALPASEIRLEPRAALRLGPHVDLRARISWQQVRRDDEPVLTALVSRLRAVYNFGTRAFVRASFQFGDTDRNPALHHARVRPSARSLGTQLLFSYKVNPLTVLFVGYGDERSGFVRPNLEEVPLRPVERSFFVKLGYGWRP